MNGDEMVEFVNFADAAPSLRADALALNNVHAAKMSLLDAQSLADLAALSYVTWIATAPETIDGVSGLIICLSDGAAYDSANYQWFTDRFDSFVYVDRVVIADAAQGLGFGRQLYERLIAKAAQDGYPFIGCEVNVEPPNPGSHAFHASMGFEAVGEQATPDGLKRVRFYKKPL